MLSLVLLSAFLRLMLSCVIAHMLTRVAHMLNARERIGAGLMGGAALMTVPVILDVNKEGTPFDTVAGLLFTFGAILFFRGFVRRKLGHERRNEEAVEQARSHLAARGH